ncbi:MAG TPA: FAD-dependent oxidoreductase, partial [Candidatus Dormibacteraeota bacterium]|nr:FAD-dependent oxidoreductase [Candidatus Dormibacteraeota bacterium]
MARTPLLRMFESLVQDFKEAKRSGRPVEEVQEERRRMRPTRRDFLKVGGAVIGAAALGGRLPAFAASSRIAIIGGGISGLNAALTLQDNGIASTVYEASSRVGGRMHSDTTSWLDGQTSEHCGELIDSGHTAILNLCTRFNLPTVDLHAAEPPNSTETYFFGGHYYPFSQATKDFEAVFDRLTADNNAAPFPTLYNMHTPAGVALDHMSVSQWIDSRVPGGHASNMGKLLDVAYNIEFGNVTTEQSSLNLVYLLYNPPLSNGFVVFGASDERFHIVGGNERLPRAIAGALRPGMVKLNNRLTGIVHNSNNSYTLTFQAPEGTINVDVDRVIMTIPFSVLRTIL